MRFLIDECLHTSLTRVANKAGYEAHHVTRRGWSGFKDHDLRDITLPEESVFVTNNARDFRKLMGASELHAGLIVILPNVTPTVQRELFGRALLETARLDHVINKIVEVESLTRSAFASCRNSNSGALQRTSHLRSYFVRGARGEFGAEGCFGRRRESRPGAVRHGLE